MHKENKKNSATGPHGSNDRVWKMSSILLFLFTSSYLVFLDFVEHFVHFIRCICNGLGNVL